MPRNSGPYGPGIGTINGAVSIFKPKQTRQHFSAEDDERIVEAVGDQSYPNWSEIAQLVPGKTGRQCRERFQHYLKPSLVQTPWTPEEDELIAKLYAEHGPNWARIAMHFKGRRTNNNIKNRWNNHLSRHCVLRYPAGFPLPDLPLTIWPAKSGAPPDSFSDTGWSETMSDLLAFPDDWPL
jgi:hypothetical protein